MHAAINSKILPLAFASAIIATVFCCAAMAQQPVTTDEKTNEQKTGAISGSVVNERGQPVAGAAVYVRAIGSPTQGRGTTTDNEGGFQVSGLEPLAYSISASIPAYASLPRDPDSTEAPYYRIGDTVKIELVKGGVITGAVTSATGEPIVAVRVRAYLIRDANDQPPRYASSFRERTTDDRGVYRIYGLAPGTYVVSAGGSNSSGFSINAYDADAPTYAPASTRDTATEISVRAGSETTNVDIRYRGEPGHVVSGNAAGVAVPPNYGINITLTSAAEAGSQWSNFAFQPPGGRGFAFNGIPDGDYDVTAQVYFPGGESALSEPQRIKVKGADVTGLALTIKSLGAISGHVSLEESKAPECKGKRRPLFGETLVFAWHNDKGAAKDQPQFLFSFGAPSSLDRQGDFTLRNLAPGQYRISTRFFAKYWYLQSATLPGSASGNARTANHLTDAARTWTTLKSADRINGLTITLAGGAASLRGQVTVSENQKLPPRLFVYLTPVEREKAEDALRFFAAPIAADGTFALNNLPPGRYWIIAKPAAENESNVLTKLRLPDESDLRTKLRREAEAGKIETELKPCQNVADYSLPLTAPSSTTKQPAGGP
jgi:Carboxypeptidase regulatory-like domain